MDQKLQTVSPRCGVNCPLINEKPGEIGSTGVVERWTEAIELEELVIPLRKTLKYPVFRDG
jgi:hypothetical protein